MDQDVEQIKMGQFVFVALNLKRPLPRLVYFQDPDVSNSATSFPDVSNSATSFPDVAVQPAGRAIGNGRSTKSRPYFAKVNAMSLQPCRPLATRSLRAGQRSSTRLATRLIFARGFVSSTARYEIKKTGLYDFHVSNAAKMVPFAGYSMPLSYGEVGQSAAHRHVRTSVGLFDVSHMLQHRFSGPSTQEFLMSLCPSSLDNLQPFTSTLSVLLNDEGGIIDDTVITKQESAESFYVVTNAGRVEEDKAWIGQRLEGWMAAGKGEVRWETLDGWGLLALQGPRAKDVLASLTDTDLANVKFGQSVIAAVGKDKVRCHIARGGYTGEDGFEISVPPEHTVSLTQEIVAGPEVMLIGLGARDSLRLEAGMCLYGHDLDESVSPVEAGLSWVIGKDRRAPDHPIPFPGKARVLEELVSGPRRRRVGLEITGAPAREGCKVFDVSSSQEIGIITSGIPSPTLGTNIAMGYVVDGQHKKGTQVMVEVRRKLREAVVRPMPFVPAKYYK